VASADTHRTIRSNDGTESASLAPDGRMGPSRSWTRGRALKNAPEIEHSTELPYKAGGNGRSDTEGEQRGGADAQAQRGRSIGRGPHVP
jgi:hypothetical protein